MIQIIIKNVNKIENAASQFINCMGNHKIFAFTGEMGVGKTTFIKAICKRLGVDDVINSPTFSIINEYKIRNSGELIYHFDFFRINSVREAQEIGTEDYFQSHSICFIEWPEKIVSLLPENAVLLNMIEQNDNSRIVTTATLPLSF